MEDMAQQQADLTAEVWKGIERLEHRMNSLRNALQHVGPGMTVTSVAQVVAEEAVSLLAAAVKADGFDDAVSRM